MFSRIPYFTNYRYYNQVHFTNVQLIKRLLSDTNFQDTPHVTYMTNYTDCGSEGCNSCFVVLCELRTMSRTNSLLSK